MSKTKFLMVAVVVLALLNVVALAALWRHPGKPPHSEGPRRLIIERLHFDNEQVAAYDILVDKHRADIRQKDNEMAAARSAIYRQLLSDDFSKKDSLLSTVGQLQMEVEQIHFTHFQEIKKLCKAEQLADFNNLAADLEQLFNKPK